jgi:hypothetical protein
MLWLRFFVNRLRNLRGEEGERQETADVALVQVLLSGKVALTRSIATQLADPASCEPIQRLQQEPEPLA